MRRLLPFFVVLAATIPGVSFATQVDVETGLQWLASAEAELTAGKAMLAKRPSDAAIGEQSRRINEVRKRGLDMFPMTEAWVPCRGVAANMGALWMYGYLGTYNKRPGSSNDAKTFGREYNEDFAKCKKALTSEPGRTPEPKQAPAELGVRKQKGPKEPAESIAVLSGQQAIPGSESRKAIGTWFDTDAGRTRSIEMAGGEYYLVDRYDDGSGGSSGKPLRRTGVSTFYPKEQTRYGDHYVINAAGQLSVRDRNGLIDTLPKHGKLWP